MLDAYKFIDDAERSNEENRVVQESWVELLEVANVT